MSGPFHRPLGHDYFTHFALNLYTEMSKFSPISVHNHVRYPPNPRRPLNCRCPPVEIAPLRW